MDLVPCAENMDKMNGKPFIYCKVFAYALQQGHGKCSFRSLSDEIVVALIIFTCCSEGFPPGIPFIFKKILSRSVCSVPKRFKLSRLLTKNISKMSEFTNPFLTNWTENHGVPPFQLIKPSHFEPAFNAAMKEHFEELKAIANHVEPANFENTIATFDRAGTLYNKVSECFSNLCSSNGVPELQEVELKMAGPLAAHQNQVYTFPGLFQRINAVYEAREGAGYSREQLRLVERFHLDFVRSGARFDAAAQARYAAVTEELANLETQFTQVGEVQFSSQISC